MSLSKLYTRHSFHLPSEVITQLKIVDNELGRLGLSDDEVVELRSQLADFTQSLEKSLANRQEK
jgi:predicted metal-binding transcription factor (methanogenesis marker protein 9)